MLLGPGWLGEDPLTNPFGGFVLNIDVNLWSKGSGTLKHVGTELFGPALFIPIAHESRLMKTSEGNVMLTNIEVVDRIKSLGRASPHVTWNFTGLGGTASACPIRWMARLGLGTRDQGRDERHLRTKLGREQLSFPSLPQQLSFYHTS